MSLSYNDLLKLSDEFRRIFKCDELRINYVVDRSGLSSVKFDAVSGAFVVNSNQTVSELLKSLCLCVWHTYRSSLSFRHGGLTSREVVGPLIRYFIQNATRMTTDKLREAMR